LVKNSETEISRWRAPISTADTVARGAAAGGLVAGAAGGLVAGAAGGRAFAVAGGLVFRAVSVRLDFATHGPLGSSYAPIQTKSHWQTQVF
jgi:hypothetical protein